MSEHQGRVLKFTASWCGPCKEIAPVLSELQARHGFALVVVDVDEEGELASRHGVVSLPTMRLERPGAEAVVVVGANAQKLRAACQAFFGARSAAGNQIVPTDASARIEL